MPDSITLQATADSLAPLAEWLHQHMASLPVNDEWRFALDLSVCEAAANVIHHALGAHSNRAFMVTFNRSGEDVEVVLVDDGAAFPPASLSKAQRKIGSDEERDLESGRGLMLILLSVDHFQVTREGNLNKTTLMKHIA